MARETLKDFLNSQYNSSDKITITLKEGDDGIGIDPNTGQELLELDNSASGLLGNYLKFITEQEGNQYIPKEGNSKLDGSQRGKYLTHADQHGFNDNFIKSSDPLNTKIQEYSKSGYFSESDINNTIDKVGIGTDEEKSGHNILKNVVGQPLDRTGKTLTGPRTQEPNKVIEITRNLFLKNNRFANVGNQTTKAFTELPQNVDQFEQEKSTTEGSMSIQTSFGDYNKNQNITYINQLKSIGSSLLLKASGFDGSSNPKDALNIDEAGDIANRNPENNTMYSINSGFRGLNFESVRPQNAKGFPEDSVTGESVRSGKGNWIEDDPNADSAKTFGATYNSEFQFQNANINLHKTQAAISMIAVKIIGKTFYDSFINTLRTADKVVLERLGESFAIENDKGDILSYVLGESKNLSSTKIDNNIFSNLLTNTRYSFGDAVNRGLQIIYGTTTSYPTAEFVSKNSKNIAQSPGYWMAVSRSILKSLDQTYKKYEELSGFGSLDSNELFLVYKDIVESNKFIQFFNVMAVIGDISLTSGNGSFRSTNVNPGNPKNVDLIPDEQGRSIPGKSRMKNGEYKEQLSWGQDSVQSMYLLPANIIRAASRLNHSSEGGNPVRAMFGSKLVKSTYTGLDVDGSYARIPNSVVKIVEDHLEAEYVPFYIQDLRTNEIVSFKAFLSQLTDSINPNYSSQTAYGRLDPVQIYQGTTRSLQVGFTLYATNREDFDTMWYKINKFVTLLYPQWTPGTMVSNAPGSKFYQPFSQVIGGSPIVRLRIGDIIKSNYSRFGLARTFGIGDTNVSPLTNTALGGVVGNVIDLGRAGTKAGSDLLTEVSLKSWLTAYGSPLSTMGVSLDAIGKKLFTSNLSLNLAGKAGKKIAERAASAALGASVFANPLAVNEVINQIIDPNVDTLNEKIGYKVNKNNNSLRLVHLKPSPDKGYINANSGEKYVIHQKLLVRVMKKGKFSELDTNISFKSDAIGYKVKVVDPDSDLLGKNLVVRHIDIYPDPKYIFNASLMGRLLNYGTDPFITGINDFINTDTIKNKFTRFALDNGGEDVIKSIFEKQESSFMRPENNPYVKAFESTKGRGIAGVIKSVSFDWLSDFPWETEIDSKAPIGCKISFGFDVIHDLPPGLDHTGYNKAPLYNVGNVMKNVVGDVYDNSTEAKKSFDKLTRIKDGAGNR